MRFSGKLSTQYDRSTQGKHIRRCGQIELYSLFAKDEIDTETLKEANNIRKKAYELPQLVIDDPAMSEIMIENTYLSCFKE